ncbi:interferon-induced, double-stranded RNA-activated protein kinase [Carassius gibelio]|uniref:interferon-induced, double-stranded RNA-activated protein kinase n=1 Tax=Carassius gibelio TaxID=101364 RepID=UPI0022783AD8|nr:interferon-induced, double-stranded RNA-activated protein kinase [Carassius gibelio]
MSEDSEIEKQICDVLRRNGKSNALKIAKEIKVDKRIVNKHLYNLERSNQVFKTDELPPVWDLLEKMKEIKQTPKPEQKPQTTRDTSEEKHVEDLLRTGALKASHIARDLRQSTQTINKQLYTMMQKGRVQKCSISNLWSLNDEWTEESSSQESDSCLQVSKPGSHSELFEMITELGDGGYGCVYKVKHKIDGKVYALKKVILTRKADSEVKALAQLDHPNIVRYITSWPGPDIWTSNQQRNQVSTTTYLFIQMEFCEGGTLTDWIQGRNDLKKYRTTAEIHKIFSEIITGVEYIHANNLIHRDLKPDNILFGADGKVKIGDFGLVAAQTDQNGDPIERSKRKGTPPYMSPEQENKKNYDEKTDIFPLGLIWFEMLWKISTGMERVKLWSDLRNQRFPEGFGDEYSAESTFIMKMLSYSPEDRPHAKDIKRDLQTFFSLEQDLLNPKTV